MGQGALLEYRRRCATNARYLQDPLAKISAVKSGQKFFSEDKDRAFEAKVVDSPISFCSFLTIFAGR